MTCPSLSLAFSGTDGRSRATKGCGLFVFSRSCILSVPCTKYGAQLSVKGNSEQERKKNGSLPSHVHLQLNLTLGCVRLPRSIGTFVRFVGLYRINSYF